MKTLIKLTASALALSVIATSPAIASGSGGGAGGGAGGGGFNTNTGPTYNPVKDYQEGVSYLRDSNFKKAERSFSRELKEHGEMRMPIITWVLRKWVLKNINRLQDISKPL